VKKYEKEVRVISTEKEVQSYSKLWLPSRPIIFQSDCDKKSKQRLADFTKSQLLHRLMQLEKEEQVQKSQHPRPCPANSFQREFEEDSVPRDLLQDRTPHTENVRFVP
jgi:hypothetical protein